MVDSDDALDAGLSALAMWEGRDVLHALARTDDLTERKEGRIWHPPPDQLPLGRESSPGAGSTRGSAQRRSSASHRVESEQHPWVDRGRRDSASGWGMPVISRFFGIVIFMNYNDHPPPHFHARYQDEEVIVEIETGIVTGRMSKRPLRMVLDWADQHGDELMEDWRRARDRRPLQPIQPLR